MSRAGFVSGHSLGLLQGGGYPNLYYHTDMMGRTPTLGFPNTNRSRLHGVTNLRSAIMNGDFRTWHEVLLQELVQYEQTISEKSHVEKFGAPEGRGYHDDLCIAAQRAQEIRLTASSGGIFAGSGGGSNLVDLYPEKVGW